MGTPRRGTGSRRPWAASAASTDSAPNRANRSRCSTTIVVTDGSRSRARNLRRGPQEAGLVGTPPTPPFSAEPISVTTPLTASPCSAAQVVTRATCRSRSAVWSAEDTRAYTAVLPPPAGTRPARTGLCSFLEHPRGRIEPEAGRGG